MKKFDESTGSVDYRRFSQEFRMRVRSAGEDFLAALLYDGDIDAVVPYDVGNVNSNDLDTITTVTLPQLRQQAHIAALRACFMPEGEAERLTRECVHAGGTVHGAPQAWNILKTRWFTTDRPKAVGSISAMLFSKPFPQELSVEAFQVHYNKVLSMATDVGLNPTVETPAAQQLRQNYWDVIANPPVGSAYHIMAAAEARNATARECTTIAHREAFLAAMVTAVDTQVKASGKRPAYVRPGPLV